MNAPFLLFQNWAAIFGMYPRAVVWNECLTGNSGQSMHTLHSFPTLNESRQQTQLSSVGIKWEVWGWGEARAQTVQSSKADVAAENSNISRS